MSTEFEIKVERAVFKRLKYLQTNVRNGGGSVQDWENSISGSLTAIKANIKKLENSLTSQKS
jgi:hypothetical protein